MPGESSAYSIFYPLSSEFDFRSAHVVGWWRGGGAWPHVVVAWRRAASCVALCCVAVLDSVIQCEHGLRLAYGNKQVKLQLQ